MNVISGGARSMWGRFGEGSKSLQNSVYPAPKKQYLTFLLNIYSAEKESVHAFKLNFQNKNDYLFMF